MMLLVGCRATPDAPAPRTPVATASVPIDAFVDSSSADAPVDAAEAVAVVAVADVVTEPTFAAKHTPTACPGNPQGMELWLDEIAPACPPQPFVQVLHDDANAIPDLCDGPCPLPCQIVRNNERTSNITYDATGRWTEMAPMFNTSAEDTVVACTQDKHGRASCTEDLGYGHPDVTTVKRDAKGRVIEIATRSNSITFKYDGAGRVIRASAPSEGASTYSYDRLGRLVSERNKFFGNVTYKYDRSGLLVAQTSAGERITYTYRNKRLVELEDVSGLLVMSGPTTHVMQFSYDDQGRPHSITFRRAGHHETPFPDDAPAGPWVTFVYDCK